MEGAAHADIDAFVLAQADGVYQIGTVADLLDFAALANDANPEASAELTANIDLSGVPWTPIGSSNNKYNGMFNANGKTIANLTITGAGKSQQGLFGFIGPEGTVKSLTLTNLSVSLTGSSNYVGGIAANSEGTIVNCVVTGAVTANQRVGGIAGSAKAGSVIAYCSNQANISGNATTTAYAGGIAGEFGGTIEYCSNTGNITGGTSASMSYVGGIAGSKSPSAAPYLVKDSYNAGMVTTASVTGKTMGHRGGLLGTSAADVTLENCLNYGSVSVDGAYGGAIATAATGTTVLNGAHYLDSSFSKAFNSTTGANLDGVSPRSAAALSGGEVLALLPLSAWEQGASYPVLKGFVDDGRYDPGFDPALEPLGDYIITSTEDLASAAAAINSDLAAHGRSYTGTITLANDIDLAGIPSWTPIGTYAYPFEGTFEGSGFTVSGLTVTGLDYDPGINATNHAGLFAALGSGASVKNVILADVFVNAGNTAYVGAVAGVNCGGSIEGVFVSGEVYARSFVGGIVGVSESGSISACGVDAEVTAANPFGSSVGGIAGVLGDVGGTKSGTVVVVDVFSLGSVKGYNAYVGGLFGQVKGSMATSVDLSNCYSLADVNSEYASLYGAIAGSAWDTSVVKAYYVGTNGIYQTGGSGTQEATALPRKAFVDGTAIDLLNTQHAGAWKPGAVSPILAWLNDQAPAQYAVTVSGGDYGDAHVATPPNGEGGKYVVGTSVTIAANAKSTYSSYVFDGWFIGDTLVSTSENYAFEVYEDTTLTARYSQNANPDTNWYDPAASDYVIKTKNQLRYFADLVNDGVDFAGKTVRLSPFEAITEESEIDYGQVGSIFDLTGETWEGIGTAPGTSFAGTFVATSIKGGTFPITLPDASPVGLFGTVAHSGTVLLTTVRGSIQGAVGDVGGIASQNLGEINSCVYEGSLTRHYASDSDIAHVGGIVGQNYGGLIVNCLNKGAVSLSGGGNENTSVGGVAGYSVGESAHIEKCENSGTVKGSNSVGGIVGELQSSRGTLLQPEEEDDYAKFTAGVRECLNTGVVAGSGDVGGIVGLSFNSSASVSKNTGAVVCDPSGRVASRFGGIIGYNKAGVVYDCENAGGVVCEGTATTPEGDKSSEVGGIVGLNDGHVTRCFNTAAVAGDERVGGIAGENLTGIEISLCFNRGIVSGTDFVGGIAGYNWDAVTIENSYSSAQLVSAGSSVGGLFGSDSCDYA
ncbi:MAG: hypothetical protein LBD25_06245, partial [Coriobacteriales bacterium]|nr:hypothetical protein [Coriobacteriales bacterium]